MLFIILQFVVVMTWNSGVLSSPPRCDSSFNIISKDGVLGETMLFQWLGVIKVHLHEDTSLRIALTGVVLVREGYAVANADDIARIPKRFFKEDSIAMFIPRDYEPWYCRLQDYLIHPEYPRQTLNTIALVKLDLGDEHTHPMRPICWPSYSTPKKLYATGYTDDNQLLEKFILKLQYIDQTVCEEFYNRAELTKPRVSPSHYRCALSKDSVQDCVWENGMAVVSNASGYWTLLGLSVLGPGCSAPGRFIDLLPYYQWIDSNTNLQEVSAPRKSTFNEGFKHKHRLVEEIEDIPAHELLRTDNITLDPVHGKHDVAHYYPFNTVPDTGDLFNITRNNQSAITIHRLRHGENGNCSLASNTLIYNEYFRVEFPGDGLIRKSGTIRYKLSMFDLNFLNYSCVKIQVVSVEPESAYLYYATEIDQLEGVDYPENPDEIIRVYPIIKKILTTTTKPLKWRPHSNLKTKMIEEFAEKYDIDNLNIYMRIVFHEVGWFKVRIFGPPIKITSTTSTTEGVTSPATSTVPTSSTSNPYYETDPPVTSAPLDDTTPNINRLPRDSDHFKRYITLSERNLVTTETTRMLHWGKPTNDEDRDDRSYWNTWKHKKNKKNKPRLDKEVKKQAKTQQFYKPSEEEAYKNNTFKNEKKSNTSTILHTQNHSLVKKAIFIEGIDQSLIENLDKNNNHISVKTASMEIKNIFSKTLQDTPNKNTYLPNDTALVEEIIFNLARKPSSSIWRTITIMLLARGEQICC